MKRLFLLSLAILAAAQFALAGLVITEEVDQSGGPMSGKTQLTISVSGDQSRVDVGKQMSSITDAQKGTVTSLLHAQKMAMQLPEGALDAVKQKVGENKPKPDIKPTGKKDTINGFGCEEYAGTIAKMKVSLWVTHEVENSKQILDQLGKLSHGGDPLMDALQGSGDVPGFPIRTVVNIPQMGKSTMTVTSIKNEDVPASTFEIPAGYKTMDIPKMSNPGGGAPAMPVEPDGN